MDVENAGVAEQDKKVQAAPVESEKQIPIENAETAKAQDAEAANASQDEEDATMWKGQGKEPQKKYEPAQEKPDPLGLRAENSPMNEIKAGYHYAFRKGKA